MRDTLRKQKGITLITLAVTIVVLLIIAGTSINYSLKSIEHSTYMTMLSEIQIIQEKVNLYYSEGRQVTGRNIEDDHKAVLQDKGVSTVDYGNYFYFTKADLREIFEIDSIEGKYLISTKDRDVICLSTIKNQGYEYTNYRLQEISDEFNVEFEKAVYKLSQKASVGDYVNYDPTDVEESNKEKTTYTSVAGDVDNHGNGAEDQKFSAFNYKQSGGKWRILDIENDGTIILISDQIYKDTGITMSTSGLKLTGGIGYMYGEEELHRICAIYGYGKGANTSKTVTYYYGGPNDQDGSIEETDTNGDGVVDNLAELQQGRIATLDLDSGARSITAQDVNKICGKTNYTENNYSNIIEKSFKNASYYPTLENPQNILTGQSKEETNFKRGELLLHILL